MAETDITGWSDLVTWFGHSPNFHDAEVIGIDLRRAPEPSTVRVHAWRTNADIDADGFYRRDRHATVSFSIHDIMALRLDGWNHQNVISELWIAATEDGYKLHMASSYGAEGEISAKQMSVSVVARNI